MCLYEMFVLNLLLLVILGALGRVTVSELDKQTFTNEFDSH